MNISRDLLLYSGKILIQQYNMRVLWQLIPLNTIFQQLFDEVLSVNNVRRNWTLAVATFVNISDSHKKVLATRANQTWIKNREYKARSFLYHKLIMSHLIGIRKTLLRYRRIQNDTLTLTYELCNIIHVACLCLHNYCIFKAMSNRQSK